MSDSYVLKAKLRSGNVLTRSLMEWAEPDVENFGTSDTHSTAAISAVDKFSNGLLGKAFLYQ